MHDLAERLASVELFAGLAPAEHYFRSLLDYTLPMASLLAGRRITAAIQDFAAPGTSRICGCPTIASRAA